jgi:hypothetical protein
MHASARRAVNFQALPRRFSNAVCNTVGVGDFDDAYLKELRDLGQPVKEDNAARGYWIGVSIDQMNGTLHGGALRELNSGGTAVGY